MTIPELMAVFRCARATLYRWDADSMARDGKPLLHRPSGPQGRVYGFRSDFEAFVRSRCFNDDAAGRRRALAD